ncbi:MAG: hypothetical protein BJ554DRAFT_8388, partial [Olpidium bornovanus]
RSWLLYRLEGRLIGLFGLPIGSALTKIKILLRMDFYFAALVINWATRLPEARHLVLHPRMALGLRTNSIAGTTSLAVHLLYRRGGGLGLQRAAADKLENEKGQHAPLSVCPITCEPADSGVPPVRPVFVARQAARPAGFVGRGSSRPMDTKDGRAPGGARWQAGRVLGRVLSLLRSGGGKSRPSEHRHRYATRDASGGRGRDQPD